MSISSSCRLALACALALAASAHAQESIYRGPCDASAAVALDGAHFAVANDESNRIAIYRRGDPQIVDSLDVGAFLRVGEGEEADIEGAAAIGSRAYWITSHGRNGKAKRQASRLRFFATDVRPGPPVSLVPAGTPYTRLLDDLAADPALSRYRLADAAKLAAEAQGGFNIEGLAATQDGQLLLGLRNPLFEGRALVIPLANPAQMIDGTSRARFGPAVELDLGGRGIRTIDLVDGAYLIVAGPIADAGTFAMYRWSGRAQDTPVALDRELRTLRPEALVAWPDAIDLLSDDGGVRVDGVECKALPAARQSFRVLTVPRR